MKHKLLRLSEMADTDLCTSDYLGLEGMIGSIIELSPNVSEVDGKPMFIMPDGETAHSDFLVTEPYQP